MKNKSVLTAFAITFLSISAFSQKITRSTIGSFGSTASSNNVTIQQTAGQPSATSHINKNDGSGIRQGFHQAFYAHPEYNELNALIFPNPNNGTFSFQVDLANEEKFSYQLTDQTGRILINEQSNGNTLVPVNVNQPIAGMYHLFITSGGRSSSFKINIIH
jgi:hypothetical protein